MLVQVKGVELLYRYGWGNCFTAGRVGTCSTGRQTRGGSGTCSTAIRGGAVDTVGSGLFTANGGGLIHFLGLDLLSLGGNFPSRVAV